MRAACLAALLALPASVAAQNATTPGAAGAEAAVGAYLAAFAEGDLERVFALTDPAETRELAELFGRLMSEGLADPGGKAFDSPPKALARFMDQFLDLQPEMSEAMESIEGSVLGSVIEGDSLAHVVARASFALFGGPMSGVELTTARWDGARWWVTFGSDLEAFRRGLEMAEEEESMMEGDA